MSLYRRARSVSGWLTKPRRCELAPPHIVSLQTFQQYGRPNMAVITHAIPITSTSVGVWLSVSPFSFLGGNVILSALNGEWKGTSYCVLLSREA